MAVKIIAFGQIAEIAGKEFTVEASDILELKSMLFERFPVLAQKKISIAINRKLVSDNALLNDNDEVALMPPYSGG